MSNKRLTAVWEGSTQRGTKLLALLSLADRSDDDGFCWPSHEDTAKRTRSARTYVASMLRNIEADGELYIHERPGDTHQYLVLPGMSDDEIRTAMKRRFGYTDEEIETKVSAIQTSRNKGGVCKTDTQVSVKLTGGVSSTEHEPSITQKEPTRGEKTPTRKPDILDGMLHYSAKFNGQVDYGFLPDRLQPLARAFVEAAGDNHAPIKADQSLWKKELRDWYELRFTPERIKGGVQKHKNEGLSIKGPQSVRYAIRDYEPAATHQPSEVYE